MPKEARKLIIASTTSTQNSGLFDVLIPAYDLRSIPGYFFNMLSQWRSLLLFDVTFI
jgi:ABC-type tungstate transport system permease subunit